MPRPTKRDQLIDKAVEVFCREGFRATGIDRLLAEAGIAKMTLYNHFRSKEDLILAALRRRDETWRRDFTRSVEARARSPRGRLLACFDALGEFCAAREFTGCMFINASAEFPDPDSPIHRACAEHKLLVREYIRGLCADAGAADPDALATILCVLLEGTIVWTYTARDCSVAHDARRRRRPSSRARSAPASACGRRCRGWSQSH